MTPTKIVMALAMLLGATSASLAWTHHRHHHHGVFNMAPGSAYHERGGPGPRVGNGTGAGVGAESGSK